MKKVTIICEKTGKVAAEVMVSVSSLNYQTNDSETYEEAWNSAVEDGLVSGDVRKEYEFQIRI